MEDLIPLLIPENYMDSEFLRHEPCEVCGSSDAKAIYADGNTFCFSCQTLTRADHTHHMPTNVQFKGQGPPMYNSKDKPNGLQKDESVRRPVSTTKYTEMETFYGSLITAVTEHFKGSKLRRN